jgi:hypothetical protein
LKSRATVAKSAFADYHLTREGGFCKASLATQGSPRTNPLGNDAYFRHIADRSVHEGGLRNRSFARQLKLRATVAKSAFAD